MTAEYRCTECGNLHKDGADCPEVLYDIGVARRESYMRALDDILLKVTGNPPICLYILGKVNELKSDYKEVEDGKAE
jgi:hypothetical protein